MLGLSLEKLDRKRLQIEHAPHLFAGAKIIKLADKITDVREIGTNPPADWPLSRKLEYFEWAKQVVDGLRGTNSGLEQFYDETVTRIKQLLELKTRLDRSPAKG